MIKYQLRRGPIGPVTVSLAATHPDETAPLQYDGDPDLLPVVRRDLETGWGLGGHTVGDRTTPADLAHAMDSPEMAPYAPRLVEGQAIIDRYQRANIPPDAAD
ncbi:MAG: hypothetical protein AAFN74_18075 [Myxococcota bacterium]